MHTLTSVNVLDYNELNKLVAKHLKLPDWDFISAEECGNDSQHLYDVLGYDGEPEPNDFIDADVVLSLLVEKKVLTPGHYLVTVCW